MAAVDHPASSLPHLQLLSDLTPPSLERTWLTAPHPRLPIVATCSSDKTVRVYSLTNFRLLSTISGGHKRSVRTAAWKPHVQGESVLATGSFDATAGIWRRWDSYGQTTGDEGWGLGQETTTNKSESQEEQAQETDILRQQQATHNENDGADDEDEEWRFAVLLDGHDSEVKSVSWSPSGMLLATCSRDKSIWIWEDLDDGDNNFETVAVMQEHEGDVKCVAWHPVEECLASASYDDTIRIWREDLDDWGQVACLRGHEGTVWFLSGPRIVSCSDDRTVRVWRRQPKEQAAAGGTGMPSILRPTGLDETWEEETVLPKVHDLAVYAVAWSKRTGLLASVGADGRIVIYEERLGVVRTEWVILAVLPGAHGIYEINHVAWANRADRDRDVSKEEEVLVTTADDGSVKVDETVGL
ncbi:uncharacterized protein An08g00420 [Aspergillus niger]|uniref:Probable cytosolic iron-sulfur protein assembly protein 1 n=2 Tax=Aspergillus niger TaxID=5061 RepID=CIAO1_ASPNC|nr:uncharacterized protein An08g00420 [Aspergillus niger]A2QPW4.1 RecName: Full=Probable cytosolic iron-sulfur protein assembly protein 1 [Aspergillus niger CBS 513.88]CAK45194.1 unnamed protein product [Aspergillus niger]